MKNLIDLIAHISCILAGGAIGGIISGCCCNVKASELEQATESIYDINESCGLLNEIIYNMINCSMVQPTLVGLGIIGGTAAGGFGYYFLRKYLRNKKENENNILL
jgi:hypothetical protein